MIKSAVRIASVILVISVMITAISACAPKPEPEYADKIAESILLAINEDDYATFSGHLDQDMKKVVPEAVFKQRNVNYIIPFGNTDLISKIPDGLRCEASSPQAGNGWHPGIIPAINISIFNQFQELSLAHDCIAEVEPGKFYLPWTVFCVNQVIQ